MTALRAALLLNISNKELLIKTNGNNNKRYRNWHVLSQVHLLVQHSFKLINRVRLDSVQNKWCLTHYFKHTSESFYVHWDVVVCFDF